MPLRGDSDMIEQFREEYSFLSNFYPAVLTFEGKTYLNSEAAYQAAKCADEREKEQFTGLTADESKRLGGKVALRSDWDEVKQDVMRAVVYAKFTQNRYLAEWLLKTGERYLQEGNRWNDTFWGVNIKTGEGENHLGKILMSLREEFRKSGLPESTDSYLYKAQPTEHIRILFGDITQSDAACIVNPANKTLLGGGADGAIHMAAGRELREECRKFGGCNTGEAKITKGYALKADFVIHTVGPHYPEENAPALLEQSYRNSLDLAKQHRIGSIAFPAISTGKYSYPKKEAVEIAVKTVLAWQAENSDYVMDVAFITTDLGIYRLFCEQFD